MLKLGDTVEVWTAYEEKPVKVEVTSLHSGYYDYQYTGVTLEDSKIVYFDWHYSGSYFGRIV